MKKLLLLFLLLFFANVAFSQQEITGIGKLQLGSSIDVLQELGYTTKIKQLTTSDYVKYIYKKNNGKYIYEIIDQDKAFSGDYAILQHIRIFYVPKYTVLNGVVLECVTLRFISDTLYAIECDWNKGLHDALDLKYGKSEVMVEETNKDYVNGYGQTFVKTDKNVTMEWETNNSNVSCRAFIYLYHNSAGEASELKSFTLGNRSISDAVKMASKRKQADITKQEEVQKRQALDAL